MTDSNNVVVYFKSLGKNAWATGFRLGSAYLLNVEKVSTEIASSPGFLFFFFFFPAQLSLGTRMEYCHSKTRDKNRIRRQPIKRYPIENETDWLISYLLVLLIGCASSFQRIPLWHTGFLLIPDKKYHVFRLIYGMHQAKMCRQACAKCSDSSHACANKHKKDCLWKQRTHYGLENRSLSLVRLFISS